MLVLCLSVGNTMAVLGQWRVFVVSGGILHNMWYNRSVGYSCLCYFGLSASHGEERTANIQTVEVETEY